MVNENVVRSASEILHTEICATLSLSQGRKESIEEQAWDVLHEVLEANSGPEFENACRLLLFIRDAKVNGFEDLCTYGTATH